MTFSEPTYDFHLTSQDILRTGPRLSQDFHRTFPEHPPPSCCLPASRGHDQGEDPDSHTRDTDAGTVQEEEH